LATNPQGTEQRVSRLIRNTYRTLMSRGMKSCWVFACDPGLQVYLKQRREMDDSRRPLGQEDQTLKLVR
jgi:DUF2075 family protein